jgi:hypothetical protein
VDSGGRHISVANFCRMDRTLTVSLGCDFVAPVSRRLFFCEDNDGEELWSAKRLDAFSLVRHIQLALLFFVLFQKHR